MCTRRINLHLKWSLERIVIFEKEFLKQKSLIASQKLDTRNFWRIANSVLNKDSSAIRLLFGCCRLYLIKQHCFDSYLDDSGTPLPVFSSRTNLKLRNIFLTPKLIKKVVTNLDLPKLSGPDRIAVAILKNYEPKVSHILAGLFNMCLKGFYFLDCW